MLKAFCGCLNVKLHFREESSPGFQANDLSQEESQDVFFQQEPKIVMVESPGVCIEHSFLMQARLVGHWNIFHCICCKMDTHAVPNSPQKPFLINRNLLTDGNQVSKLQQSERYSSVYKVVLPWLGSSGPSSPGNFPDRGSHTDQAVAIIQQVMAGFLKKEDEKIKEKIQRFTEQQQAYLQAIETRVRQERNALLMLLAEKEAPVEKRLQSMSLRSQVTPPATPTKRGSFNFTSPTKELPPSMPIRRGPDNPEDDILFDFDADYLEHDTSTGDPFDTPDFDNDDTTSNEGVSIPRRHAQRPEDGALAKSLPMRVPAMSNYRSQDIDIEDKTPQNEAEMAASIKALARSVHGSDASWDLPRPRLNTLDHCK